MEQVQQENNEDDLSPSLSPLSHSKKKRTRDLPNLTQCHSCGFRIDSCSGNDFLQILYSQWRIVLLCHNCFVSVESCILCSYCFKPGSSSDHDDDCFSCPQCKRIIHKSCFSSHSNVAPWSFCCSTTSTAHFSICLDCWVPKLAPGKKAYCSSSKRKKNPSVFYPGDNRKRLLKNALRDVNFEAATRARELAVEKAVGARRTALGDNAVSGIDDVQLNCSRRFSKNFCSVNSNPLVTNGFPQTSVLVRVSDYDSSDSLGSNGIGSMKVPLKEGEGGCSNKFVNSVSQSCKGGDGSIVPADESYDGASTRYFIKYARKGSANVLGDGEPDRYMIKYTRRALAHETYNGKTNRYLIKYARRTSAYQRYNGKTNRYLIKYARRTSAYQRYKGKPGRFAIKYTRRKLNQRPILDSKSYCLNEAFPTKLMLELLNG